MPAKRLPKEFVRHRDAPAYLIVVVTMIALIFSSLSKWWIITPIFFLLVVWLINIMLEPRRQLIEKYKSLMNHLENLTARNKSTSVWQVVMDTLRNKKNLQPSWVYYFDEKGTNVNTAFYDLNVELENLIINPYRLLYKNTPSIEEKFKSLVRNNKELYEKFIEMINTENIHKDAFNYEAIKKEHNDFYSLLRQSRNEFTELKTDFIDEFFAPLPEPRFPSIPIVY